MGDRYFFGKTTFEGPWTEEEFQKGSGQIWEEEDPDPAVCCLCEKLIVGEYLEETRPTGLQRKLQTYRMCVKHGRKSPELETNHNFTSASDNDPRWSYVEPVEEDEDGSIKPLNKATVRQRRYREKLKQGAA